MALRFTYALTTEGLSPDRKVKLFGPVRYLEIHPPTHIHMLLSASGTAGYEYGGVFLNIRRAIINITSTAKIRFVGGSYLPLKALASHSMT